MPSGAPPSVPSSRKMVSVCSVGMRSSLSSLLGLQLLLGLASGLYFHIGETEKKCFIEEIPDETMIIGELTERARVSQANANR